MPFPRTARRVVPFVLALTAPLATPAHATPTAPVMRVGQFVPAQAGVRFSQLYKLRYVTAKSVEALLKRTFANVTVTLVPDVNAVMVTAVQADHQRIADAIATVDVPPNAATVPSPVPNAPTARVASDAGSLGVEVVTLHAALPGVNGAPSSSANDIAQAVTQALGGQLPDLHVTVYGNQSQLLVTGSANTIRIAKQLIESLDTLPKMVVFDVTIVEVDESVSKNLGLSLNPAVISTTYSETTPAAPLAGGTAPPLLGLQPLQRTPLSLGLQLNLLIQNGKGKVVANPKLTTISGRTASMRSGDNIAILTTTGGSVGTVATTQLVTFNTGVQLDLTPVINADDFISVTLHQTLNNLSSILNGVPQISTRDAQTTVALHEGQTLVIGGLIEDSINRSDQRIPILGYLPVVGKLFTQSQVTGARNELIIMISPHIVNPLTNAPTTGPAMTDLPTPPPLRDAPSFIALPPSGAGTPAVVPTPVPTATPTVAPVAYVYGTRPPAIPIAGPRDAPRIFYLSVTPQLVRAGTPVTIEAVTSPNITTVNVQLGAVAVGLTQGAPGLWSATIPFSAAAPPQKPTPFSATLNAMRADGVATSLAIPLTVLP